MTKVETVLPTGEVRVILNGLDEAGRRRVNAAVVLENMVGGTRFPEERIVSIN